MIIVNFNRKQGDFTVEKAGRHQLIVWLKLTPPVMIHVDIRPGMQGDKRFPTSVTPLPKSTVSTESQRSRASSYPGYHWGNGLVTLKKCRAHRLGRTEGRFRGEVSDSLQGLRLEFCFCKGHTRTVGKTWTSSLGEGYGNSLCSSCNFPVILKILKN